MAAPQTKLEAVNEILANSGLSPVGSLSGDLTQEVAEAVRMLDQVSRTTQGENGGWNFNTEDEYEITPSSSEIVVPDNWLEVQFDSRYSGRYDPVIRGDAGTLKLYCKYNHAFNAFVDTETIKARVILQFDFDDLPPLLRHWVTIQAARRYAAEFMAEGENLRFSERDEIDAKVAWKRADNRSARRQFSTQMQKFQPTYMRGPGFYY